MSKSVWMCIAVGVMCFVIGFVLAVQCSCIVERDHIKAGHTPYLDKETGLMWESHNKIEPTK